MCPDVDETTDSTALDRLIKLQSKEYYELYDTLAKSLKKKDQIEILKSNGERAPDSKHEVNCSHHFLLQQLF